MRQSVQAVFRSLASLEKTVEKCHIVLQEQKNRLTFTLHCKHGIENVALFYPRTANYVYQHHFAFHAFFLCFALYLRISLSAAVY